MKGSKKVLDILAKLLTAELTAADQYFAHSRMFQNWGLTKLYDRIAHERDEELEHADKIIRRILFLEGTPDVGKHGTLSIGQDVPEIIADDLRMAKAEHKAVVAAITLAEAKEDFITRHELGEILEEVEDYIDWLETQQDLIKSMGLPNYLQAAMGEIAD
ncbi:putative bacterioferritin subunit 2 [Magnetospirillum sp. LM-5]|uniref:bacterioferritin n=1 Tax=Magnetospirillum sp. LM-5 TaxID=2681466 RepID=UPI0013855632|nr:bacterioferritin [Magnetospirillum sp. LM-5]CAA7616109.1 putative bacterioferritin subunit 2 [Magnetospirillum sp. LM-5]